VPARADGFITGPSHRACMLWSRLSCNDFLIPRRVIARDDPTAATGATVGKGGRLFVAVGAVSGTVLSFEMGLLWPGLMGALRRFQCETEWRHRLDRD
jgi:hypothetical protein